MHLAVGASIVALSAALLAPPVRAAAPAVAISVAPLVVQFHVQPGDQASQQVTIKNVGASPARITVRQNDWTTALDGTVKLERVGAEGSHTLNPLLKLTAEDFILAVGDTKELVLTLAMPSNFSTLPQDYWGGYFIRATPVSAPAGSFGAGATVLAYNTIGAPRRHVKFTTLRVDDKGAGAATITARIFNDGGTYARPTIALRVEQPPRIVQTADDSTPVIFAGNARVYTHDLTGLARGTYLLEMTIDYGGDTLSQATTEFTVR